MANLSQQKREHMLAFLNKVKEEHKDDDETLIALGEIENELNSKKYGLVWEKHEEEVDRMMQNNIPVFTEVKEREIKATDENSYNFLLEGDNLHSLKLLEKTHAGKIDVIYIDPPYNTGSKDFIYDDAYVDKMDGYAHSKWLSFMSERLEIAKRLLSGDGVIFISIDNNEQAQLKLLCDEIFGEVNFIQNFKWNKTSTPPSLSLKTREKYEYVLCYEKRRTDIKYNGGYTDGGDVPLLNSGNPIRELTFDPKYVQFSIAGKYKSGKYGKVQLLNDLIVQNGKASNAFSLLGEFKWTQEKLDAEIKNGTYFLIKSDQFSVRFQRKQKAIKTPSDILAKTENGVDTNEQARKELDELVPDNNMPYPKPVSLINYLIRFNENGRQNSTVLDFFAGSGTTAQAVLELNKEDGGNRNFILCTNNENNICEEVTYERIKRVIHGYSGVEGIPGNLKYFKTDFIAKDADDVSEELLSHIKEMVELENGITLDNKHYLIVLSDEQADELAKSWSNYKDVKAIYVSRNVLFTSEQNALFSNTEIHIIPDYYFEYELKEVGETW